ncbi:glycerophosphodiester phosphodiesterase family protein [Marisediminicola sp. LYQ134]|uniref:glycerophosphodiester phosphodiesterase family protein n=1 Tax=Marisediminicola sp. LYQ134 TaxID=3391061 RepID=UPI0039833A1A
MFDDRPRSPFFRGTPPRVIAHRGLALEAPENTVLAFAAALAAGADILETDVHVSADDIAVVSHDPDLSRLAGRAGDVSHFPLSQLATIDLGSGQTFSSLAEVLSAFPDARFNVDVKTPGAIGPTVAAVRSAKASDRVLITSFSDSTRRDVVRRLPGVATSASPRIVMLALLAILARSTRLLGWVTKSVDAMQVPERYGPVRVVTARTVACFHAVGMEVHVWTVNEARDMDRLLDIGVDGLVTDRADLARIVIEARKSRGI